MYKNTNPSQQSCITLHIQDVIAFLKKGLLFNKLDLITTIIIIV